VSERFVTIASSCSLVEAHVLKARLEENGVIAGAIEEPSSGGLGVFGAHATSFAVQVPESDYHKARQLLRAFEVEREFDEDHNGFRVVRELEAPDAIRAADDLDDAGPSLPLASDRPEARVENEPRPSEEDRDNSHGYQRCLSCQSTVDAGRSTCHWCGASMTDQPLETREAPSDESVPVQDLSLVVDDAALADIKSTPGDDWARQAYLLAIAGILLMCVPITCVLSLAIVMWVNLRRYYLSEDGMRHMRLAAIIDTVVLMAWLRLAVYFLR
jgi:hypothetical protein